MALCPLADRGEGTGCACREDSPLPPPPEAAVSDAGGALTVLDFVRFLRRFLSATNGAASPCWASMLLGGGLLTVTSRYLQLPWYSCTMVVSMHMSTHMYYWYRTTTLLFVYNVAVPSLPHLPPAPAPITRLRYICIYCTVCTHVASQFPYIGIPSISGLIYIETTQIVFTVLYPYLSRCCESRSENFRDSARWRPN